MPLSIKFLKLVALFICIAVLFTGCSAVELTGDDLIRPPKPTGEMYDIEKALTDEIQGKFALKYPTAGNHRSAYIRADLMGSGREDFVIAFYSILNSESVSTMHMNLLKKVDNSWISISDVSIAAIGVEKVDMMDFDKDGIKEIVVGWNIYGGIDKKLAVYELSGLSLVPVVNEPYTNFITCDLDQNSKEGLLLLHHDIPKSSASVTLYSFTESGVAQVGKCPIDGMVTAFSTPVNTKLADGRPAVFIDAAKNEGLQTEIIYLENGKLETPTYVKSEKISPTYRASSVAAMDINGDGGLEIPLQESFDLRNILVDVNTLDTITRWSGYNGTAFVPQLRAVMNYTDGYYFVIPDSWSGKVTVTKDIDTRQRIFNLWDTEEGTLLGELFRLRTVDENEWDIENNGFTGYKEIARGGSDVYIALIGAYEGELSVTAEQIKNSLQIIK